MREHVIEDHLVKRAKAAGGEVRKVRWIGRRGAPDRFVMLPRFSFWAELKASGEELEAHQEREHARMKRMGQLVVVLDTVEKVDAAIGAAVAASQAIQLAFDEVEGND